MKAAVPTSTAAFAFSPSGQSAASYPNLRMRKSGYALAACREPSDIPPARVIDRRRVAAGGLAADDPASHIVVRRRAAAVGRRVGCCTGRSAGFALVSTRKPPAGRPSISAVVDMG
jgi:hypothetical protein